MNYKGYTGSVEYNEDDNILHGRVQGIGHVVSYEGNSLAELEEDFRAGIDSYLDTCVRRSIEPAKPFQGKFLARVGPEVHRKLSEAAKAKGISLNQFVTAALTRTVARSSR